MADRENTAPRRGEPRGYAALARRKAAVGFRPTSSASGRASAQAGPPSKLATGSRGPLSTLGNTLGRSRPPSRQPGEEQKPPATVIPKPAKPAEALATVAQPVPARQPASSAMGAAPSSAAVAASAAAPTVHSCCTDSLAASIGSLDLDGQDRLLQQELAQYDQRLRQLRTAETPSSAAASALGARPSMQLQAAPAPSPQFMPAAPASSAGGQPRQQQVAPKQESVVRAVITATGQGCKDVLAAHTSHPIPRAACWTTRGHRVLLLESSCMLQLQASQCRDVVVRIAFADPASVPATVRFEHAARPSAPFEPLGEVRLQARSLQQPRHLFRLCRGGPVQRCLRITLLGHLSEQSNSGAHRVSYLLITGQLPEAPAASDLVTLQHSQALAAEDLAATASSADVPQVAAEIAGAAGVRPPATARQCDAKAAGLMQGLLSPPELAPAPGSPGRGSIVDGASVGAAQHALPVEAAEHPGPLAAPTDSFPAAQGPPHSDAAGQPDWQLPESSDPCGAAALRELAAAATSSTGGALCAGEAAPCGVTPSPSSPAVAADACGSDDAAGLGMTATLDVGGLASAYAAAQDPMEMPSDPACMDEVESCSRLSSMQVADAASLAGIASLDEGHVAAVGAAATLLSAACREVDACQPLLSTILNSAMLVGSFLNAGAVGGFQIDALLKLKDVRSSRPKCPTLLHFVARAAATGHPGSASLHAALPSCSAAACLDLPAVQEQLRQLVLEVEGRSMAAGSVAALQVEELQQQLGKAEAAFRRLGMFLNGQPGTMATPSAFFTVLDSLAADLQAAHEDNRLADDAKSGGHATGTAGGSDVSRRTTSPLPQQPSDRRSESGLHRSVLLTQQDTIERIKRLNHHSRHSHAVAGHHVGAAPAPSAAAESLFAAELAVDEPPVASIPADSVVACEQLPVQPAALSTPVMELLRESDRLIRSADCELAAALLQLPMQAERPQQPGVQPGAPAAPDHTAWVAVPSPHSRYTRSSSGDEEAATEAASGAQSDAPTAADADPYSVPVGEPQSVLRQRLTLSPSSTPLSRMSSARQLSACLSGSTSSTPASSRLLPAVQGEAPGSAKCSPLRPDWTAPGQRLQQQAAASSDLLGEERTPVLEKGRAAFAAVAPTNQLINPTFVHTGTSADEVPLPVRVMQLSPGQQLEQRVEASLVAALAARCCTGGGSQGPAELPCTHGSKHVSFSLPTSPRESGAALQQADPSQQVAPRPAGGSMAAVNAPGTQQQDAAMPPAELLGSADSTPTLARLLASVPSAPMLAEKLGDDSLAIALVGSAGTHEPSPISYATRNIDAAVAALAARAGNSPTGPLACGVRDSKTFDDMAAAQELRSSGTGMPAVVHLLEPLFPPPLGEGVRASQTMAEGLSNSALRASLEQPRRMLRSAAGGGRGLAAGMNEHESEVFELQQHLQAGQQLLKGMQKPWQAAPAAAECGLSPVAMAQHHAATGRAMSPATAALQEVWPDLNLSDGAGYVQGGYVSDRGPFRGIKRLLRLRRARQQGDRVTY